MWAFSVVFFGAENPSLSLFRRLTKRRCTLFDANCTDPCVGTCFFSVDLSVELPTTELPTNVPSPMTPPPGFPRMLVVAIGSFSSNFVTLSNEIVHLCVWCKIQKVISKSEIFRPLVFKFAQSSLSPPLPQ